MLRRRSDGGVFWFLILSALGGCTGGQTGQPSQPTARCDVVTVAASERVNGLSPAELGRAFEGSHSTPLQWVVSAMTDGAAPGQDVLTITVTYAGAAGTSCSNELSVEVEVEVSTRDSGVLEKGSGILSGSLETATLTFEGTRLTLVARLTQSSGSSGISGDLRSLTPDLPGETAVFPPPNATNTGTGGAP